MISKCSNVLLKIKLRVTKLFLNATCIKTGTKMAQSSKVVDIKASVNRLSLSSICLRAARSIRIMFFIYLFFYFYDRTQSEPYICNGCSNALKKMEKMNQCTE